jgi:hypothetical protein
MAVKAYRVWVSLLGLALALLVSGCATGARTGAMTVPVTPDTIITASSPLHSAIRVGTIKGGSETNPLWMSNVSDDNFRQALEQSLGLQAMLASDNPRYAINADLISLDRPLIALNTTVTATIHYTLTSSADQAVKLEEVVATPYTANLSDAFVGFERLRLANEGAMRENIKAIIAKLIAATQPGQPLAQ